MASSSSYSYQESSFQSSGNGGAALSNAFQLGSSGSYQASFGSAGLSGASNGSTSQVASDLLQLRSSGSGASFSASNGGSASFGASNGGSVSFGASNGGSASFGALNGGSVSISASNGSASFSASGSSSATVLSEIEQAILRSNVPIDINETEEITVLGQRGIWANKQEVINWRGVIPITEYVINEDANPEIITKRSQQTLTYIQELAIRYLRPPTPPAPGEIVITQEINSLTPPAPPLVIRQQPARADTPEPLVIREAPPQAPAAVGRKVITISGKRLPPPPRKVVIERLAPLPSKPQSVLVERWLPYSQVKRRVIFQRANERDAVAVRPRNVIVQWEAPQVEIKKEFKYLGVIRANPVEYVQRYGASLKVSRELPQFVLDIKTPDGLVLAADYQYNSVYELEGDVQAMKLVDLDREGLSEYRALLAKLGISYVGAASVASAASSIQVSSSSSSYSASSSAGASFGGVSGSFNGASASLGGASFSSGSSASGSSSSSSAVVNEIFSLVDRDSNGRISVEEAEKVLLRLNSRLGRRYGENEVRSFFQALDTNRDGSIDLEEFRRAFIARL